MNRAILLVSLLFTPAMAHPATYYVAKTGRDGYTCSQALTLSTARLTLKAGLACLAPGDTLVIKAGTYTEGVEPNAFPSGLSNTQRTIVRSASGETVVINGVNSSVGDVWTIEDRSYVTLDGLTIDGSNATLYGLRIGRGSSSGPGSHFVTVQNSIIQNVRYYSGIYTHGPGGVNSNLSFVNLIIAHNGDDRWDHGIYLTSRDSLIEHCSIFNNSGHGIHAYITTGGISNNVIRCNDVYSNGSFGILIGSGDSNVAYSNIVWGNGQSVAGSGGMWIAYNGATRNKVYNNTIYGNTGNCVVVRTDTSAAVRNNICWSNSVNTIYDETGTAAVSNNLFTDPNFVNILAHNFNLSAGSAAINSGMTLPDVLIDYNRIARPQGGAYDIGAIEYTGSLPPPTGLHILVGP